MLEYVHLDSRGADDDIAELDSWGEYGAHVYFEDEPGRRQGGQVAHERRGAADRRTSQPRVSRSDVPRLSFFPKIRQYGSRPISPSCQTYSAREAKMRPGCKQTAEETRSCTTNPGTLR